MNPEDLNDDDESPEPALLGNGKKVVLKEGTMYRIVNEQNSVQLDSLPPAVYTLKAHPMLGLYLEQLEPFDMPPKLYSNAESNADRICAAFEKRPGRTTGVLLSGEKGSGKSMTAKLVCNKMIAKGVSTVFVSGPFCGDSFNQFLQSIPGSAVVFFDEFEKVYDYKQQEQLLTLFDGAYPMHKLMLLTVNDPFKVGNCFHNRPGRIYYSLDYGSLAPVFIEEYCNDNLVNKSHVEGVLTVAKMFRKFNFDMMKAMVDEMNMFNESADVVIRMLNVRPTRDYSGQDGRENETFKVSLLIDGKPVPLHNENVCIDPTNDSFTVIPKELMSHLYAKRHGHDEDGNPPGKKKRQSDLVDMLLKISEDSTDEYDDVQSGIKFSPNDAVRINSLEGKCIYVRNIDNHQFVVNLKSIARNQEFDFKRHVTVASGYGDDWDR